MKRTHYNQDFKLKIVQNYLKGISTRHLCSEYKIPKSTALYWISKYRNICNTKGKIVTIADYNELNRQNERNELRLKIYKSTGLPLNHLKMIGLKQSTISVKIIPLNTYAKF